MGWLSRVFGEAKGNIEQTLSNAGAAVSNARTEVSEAIANPGSAVENIRNAAGRAVSNAGTELREAVDTARAAAGAAIGDPGSAVENIRNTAEQAVSNAGAAASGAVRNTREELLNFIRSQPSAPASTTATRPAISLGPITFDLSSLTGLPTSQAELTTPPPNTTPTSTTTSNQTSQANTTNADTGAAGASLTISIFDIGKNSGGFLNSVKPTMDAMRIVQTMDGETMFIMPTAKGPILLNQDAMLGGMSQLGSNGDITGRNYLADALRRADNLTARQREDLPIIDPNDGGYATASRALLNIAGQELAREAMARDPGLAARIATPAN